MVRNTSSTWGLTITPDRGRYPDVTPFAKVKRSGCTPKVWAPNQLPVRPKPQITSSKISRAPLSSHSRRVWAR